MELPVEIGETNYIIIYQSKGTYSGSGQSFNGKGSNASYSKDSHSAVLQLLQSFRSYQHFRSGKSMHHYPDTLVPIYI
jgi:hypothetical protein